MEGLPELDELLDEELLELGIEGDEGDDEEEGLGIDGEEGDDEEEELGIDGEDEDGDDGDDGELGIDGMEELLELDWVDSQPASTKPIATATARALTDGAEIGLLIVRSSTVASRVRSRPQLTRRPSLLSSDFDTLRSTPGT